KKQILPMKQANFHLFQEAVWEAFRIFFDRIPGTAEYQRWVHTCQHESLCISDLAKNFSSSEEHISMIQRVRKSRMRSATGRRERIRLQLDLLEWKRRNFGQNIKKYNVLQSDYHCIIFLLFYLGFGLTGETNFEV
uniref:Uncharacterized protein n=1 Tax=Myripristis murdjan TaxID=586833 RepID=A0A667YG07_9TELE